MNKKKNTYLFILGGTVFNVLMTLVIFFILLAIFARFFSETFSQDTGGWIFLILFALSTILTFLLYRLGIKFLMKKIDFEKYFEPIFGRRRPPPKGN